MAVIIGRRELLAALGGAAALSLAARAQQPAMPVIGFLGVTFAHEQPQWLAAFRQGLHEIGFVEGENVLIEYRWADGQYNRLPELASDLVHRHVRCHCHAAQCSCCARREGCDHDYPISVRCR